MESEIKYRERAESLLEMLGDSEWHPMQKTTERLWQGESMTMMLLDRNREGMTAGDISSYLSIGSGGVANILNNLEKKGLIERNVCAHDRRRVMVTLSDKGIACITEKKQAILLYTENFLREVGDEDSREIIRLTEKILKIQASRRENGTGQESLPIC